MEDINDIKPVISLDYLSPGTKMALLLAACVLLAVLAAWLAYRYARRRLESVPPAEIAKNDPVPDAREEAERALGEAEKRILAGEYKEFHLLAASAVRTYLGRRLRLPAADMTSRELLALGTLPSALRSDLEAFLPANDQAKFAGAESREEAARSVLAMGRELIAKDYAFR